MTSLQVIGYSILVGFVSAGFVWYGWELLENIRVLRIRRRLRAAAKAAEKSAESKGTATPEPAAQGK